jgi:hypothetical protein
VSRTLLNKNLSLIIFSGVLLLQISQFARAASASGSELVDLPDHLSISEKKLELNGKAFRTASIFKVKVYLSGLYLEAKSHDENEILESKNIKVILLNPLRDISKNDTVKAWDFAFEENCEKNCTDMKDEIKKFEDSVAAFKKGDHYKYIFKDDGVTQLINDKEVFHSSNPKFGKLLLATWIGAKPPTDHLKSSLLAK